MTTSLDQDLDRDRKICQGLLHKIILQDTPQTMLKEIMKERFMSGSFLQMYLFLKIKVEEGELVELFSPIGIIEKLKIYEKDDGFTFCIIEFEEANSAQKAIERYLTNLIIF